MVHAANRSPAAVHFLGAAALAMLSGCVLGPGDYSWYCDKLNSSPSTWKVVLTSSGTCGGVPELSEMQFDSANQAQSCGPACACTISSWSFAVVGEETLRGEKRLNPPSAESCQASIACTVSGATVFSGNLEIPDWGNTASISLAGVMSDGAQCQITVAGAPQ